MWRIGCPNFILSDFQTSKIPITNHKLFIIWFKSISKMWKGNLKHFTKKSATSTGLLTVLLYILLVTFLTILATKFFRLLIFAFLRFVITFFACHLAFFIHFFLFTRLLFLFFTKLCWRIIFTSVLKLSSCSLITM